MTESMVTTTDNPFDPFTEFDDWYDYDERAGYHTTAFLDRVIVTSSELSEADASAAIDFAVDQIVSENVLGIYKKVER